MFRPLLHEETVMKIFQQGGIVFWIIGLCSILAVFVIIERILILTIVRARGKRLMKTLFILLKRDRFDEALGVCETHNSYLADMFLAGLQRKDKSKEVINEALQRHAAGLNQILERRLAILATLGTITPFIGLFGTVLGIIQTFKGLSFIQNSFSAEMIAGGIAQALLNTAAGLMVAIPAVIAYNFLSAKITSFMKDLEIFSSEFVELLKE